MTAALKYAAANWRVIPVRRSTKHPGSVLGEGWQYQSSSDPAVIAAWFAGCDYGVGLHAGASGAVIFDIDKPELLPEPLRQAAEEYAPPFQSTRPGQPGRGHLIFALRPGQALGNSRGRLYDAGTELTTKSHAWGEVRGLNGFIVAEPSVHADADGAYDWQGIGAVPYVPDYVSELLPLGRDRDAPVTEAAVEAFLAEHSGGTHAHLMAAPLERFTREVADGGSRHEALVATACWIARDVRAGLYDAPTAFSTLESLFLDAMAAMPTPGRHPANEFQGVLAWAVAQVAAPGEPTPAQHREAVLTRLYGPAPEPPTDPEPPPPREPPEPTPNTPAPATADDPEQEHDVVESESSPGVIERAYDAMVREEVRRQSAREDAARILAERQDGTEGRKHLRERALSIAGLRSLPPTTPLIDGLLARDTLAQLSGPPGSYKSFVALAMALSVATGRRFEEHDVPAAGPVVYVAAEGSSGMLARALAWCHLNGVDPDALDGQFYVVPEPVQLNGAVDVTEAVEFAAEIGAALVVLDTRHRCTLGLEENSSSEQGRAIHSAERIQRASGATVLVIHHSGRTGEHGRGSNAWDGAVWSELRLTGADLRVKITCEKHKDWPDACQHTFAMQPTVVPAELMPGASEQQRSTLVTVQGTLWTAPRAETKNARIVQKIVWTMATPAGLAPGVIRDLAMEQGGSRSGAYEALNSLVTSGFLRNVGTDKAPRYVTDRPAPSDLADWS
nr:AAA family ATPase [Quadrisphaera sp. RL12-1S]